MRLSFLEAPAEAVVSDDEWIDVRTKVRIIGQDAILLNEMPFGQWLPGRASFEEISAEASIGDHEGGFDRWRDSTSALLLSSRPVSYKGRLVNEAFATKDSIYLKAHHKQYLPEEPGFHEQTWFLPGQPGFEAINVGDVKVGFLICTELMFTEWARWYGSAGVHVIVVPRASGGDKQRWRVAAQMAAITSGCYVVSSNRVGRAGDRTSFNGCGFAVGPDGELIAETCRADPIKSITVDVAKVERQRRQYPCYLTSPPR